MNKNNHEKNIKRPVWTAIAFVVITYLLGIPCFIIGVKEILSYGINTQRIVMVFLFGIAPVFCSTYILLNYLKGREVLNIDVVNEYEKFNLLEKSLVFILSLFKALLFFGFYCLIQSLSNSGIIPRIIGTIVDGFFISAILLFLLLSIGKHKVFSGGKHKEFFRFLVALFSIIFFIIYKILSH